MWWLALCGSLIFMVPTRAGVADADAFSITPAIQAVLNSISADSLRGHLSFIASDLLEGRDSPSQGLDIAAEYIAAQFRRSGLRPMGDNGYFQTANWLLSEQDATRCQLNLEFERKNITVARSELSFRLHSALDVASSDAFKVDYTDSAALSILTATQIEGKIVLTEIPDLRKQDNSGSEDSHKQRESFLAKLRTLKARLLISVDRSNRTGSGAGPGRLIDPENREQTSESTLPWIRIHNLDWIKTYDGLKLGLSPVRVKLSVPAPTERHVKLHNVAGLLRGSDPTLKETCVIVSAHYDHIGIDRRRQGDQIFNGANDDGSGTVSVIELASALSHLDVLPRRSILFLTLFGEEKGLLGSRFYVRHPLFPLEKTIADINLEVIGRSDGTEGVQKNRAALTGFDYSSLGKVFERAGELSGVAIYRHERFSDLFFNRSDNQTFADQGIPSHTLCSVFLYSDLHQVSDHWDKIDYPNLERITRAVALALMMIADGQADPQWNEGNPKVTRYAKKWRERRKP
jgi:hypothetical protein